MYKIFRNRNLEFEGFDGTFPWTISSLLTNELAWMNHLQVQIIHGDKYTSSLLTNELAWMNHLQVQIIHGDKYTSISFQIYFVIKTTLLY